jgi:hypothetical protein
MQGATHYLLLYAIASHAKCGVQTFRMYSVQFTNVCHKWCGGATVVLQCHSLCQPGLCI